MYSRRRCRWLDEEWINKIKNSISAVRAEVSQTSIVCFIGEVRKITIIDKSLNVEHNFHNLWRLIFSQSMAVKCIRTRTHWRSKFIIKYFQSFLEVFIKSIFISWVSMSLNDVTGFTIKREFSYLFDKQIILVPQHYRIKLKCDNVWSSFTRVNAVKPLWKKITRLSFKVSWASSTKTSTTTWHVFPFTLRVFLLSKIFFEIFSVSTGIVQCSKLRTEWKSKKESENSEINSSNSLKSSWKSKKCLRKIFACDLKFVCLNICERFISFQVPIQASFITANKHRRVEKCSRVAQYFHKLQSHKAFCFFCLLNSSLVPKIIAEKQRKRSMNTTRKLAYLERPIRSCKREAEPSGFEFNFEGN